MSRSRKLAEGRVVTGQDELERLVRDWSGLDAIGLDTEFVRTRTFYPKLGLIQVGDPSGNTLIDVLAIEDWSAFVELLGDDSTLKVLHSCGEDLDVLYHQFGVVPEPIFDTQIGATLAGHGYSLGYQRLVAELFDLDLPKGETRSDWLKRPLSASQLEYAALDVAYLLPIHERLSAELERRGRARWAREEFERLGRIARARVDPAWAFDRLKKNNLTPRQRSVLKALSAWREQEARERDLPRGFVVTDDVLLRLARRQPRRAEQLEKIPGLKGRERRRSGDELIEVIRTALKSPIEQDNGPENTGRSKGTVDALKAVVVANAESLDLPAEFLAQRRVLKDLVSNYRAGVEPVLPGELRGWRRGAIGGALLEELERIEGGEQ